MISTGELLSFWASSRAMMWTRFSASNRIYRSVFVSILPHQNSTWDKRTGPNAPLYDMEDGSPGFSVHSCVENWKAGGGRPSQM